MAIEGLGESRSRTNYLKSGVWRCPVAQLSKVEIAENLLLISYGYNMGGVVSDEDENADNNFGLGGHPSIHAPVRDSQVVSPADMMAIGEIFKSRIAFTRDAVFGVAQFA